MTKKNLKLTSKKVLHTTSSRMYLVVKFLRSMIILGLGLVSVMYVYPRKSSDLTLLVVHLVPTWKLESLKSST